jgi:hypothetical protein
MPVPVPERPLPAPIDSWPALTTLASGFRALRAAKTPLRLFNNLQGLKAEERRISFEINEIVGL